MAVATENCNDCAIDTTGPCPNDLNLGSGVNVTSGKYTIDTAINNRCDAGYQVFDLMCADYDVSYLPYIFFSTQRVDDNLTMLPKNVPGIMANLSQDGLGMKR